MRRMRLFLSWAGSDCGFEDCTTLLALLDRHGADWKTVFRKCEEARKVNADAIADLAIENFVEMRDRVADPRFLFRKKVELALRRNIRAFSCRNTRWSRFIAFHIRRL